MDCKGLKMKGKAIGVAFSFFYLYLFFIIMPFINPVYADLATGASPGMINLVLEGTSPFDVYKSLDNESWDFIGNFDSNVYTEYGLDNGETYWFKVLDGNGMETVSKYTVPYTVLPMLPLEVVQFGDDYVHLKWAPFSSNVDLYCNGELVASDIWDNSYTISDLEPTATYKFYTMSRVGVKSNTLLITLPDELTKMVDKLDQLLNKIFVPDFNIDSDGDGVADPFDRLESSWERMQNYEPLRIGQDTKNAIDNLNNSFDSTDDGLPKLEVDFGMGQVQGFTFNVFDLSEFEEEIHTIRLLLSSTLWIGLFLYFLQVLVPKLKV